MSESKHPKRDKFVELFKKKTSGMHPNDFRKNLKGFRALMKDPELEDAWDEALLEKCQ